MGDFNDRFGITRNDSGEKVRKLPDFPSAPKPAAASPAPNSTPTSVPSGNPIKAQMAAETSSKAALLKSVAADPDVAAAQERDAAKAANVARYQVDVPDQYYKVFGDYIAKSDDPDTTAYRLATAWRYTQMYDMSFDDAYKNIENLNQALLGDRQYSTAKDNFAAVSDAWQLGLNVVQRGALGTNLAIAEDNGNPYEIDRIRKAVADVDTENTGLEDRQPRSWYIEALKFGAQSAPFTGAAIGAGLVGGLFGPVAAGGAAFAVSMQNAQGSEYLDLRSEGVKPDLARNLSIASGGLQAVVEVALGNTASVVGKAAGVETITSNLFKRMHVTGAWTRAARVIGEYGGEAVEEGVEEALQDLISSGSQALAAELQGEGVEQKTSKEIAQSAWENFRGGFLGSLVLGVAGAGINAHTEVRDAIALKDASVSMDSKEAFIKETAESPAFEGLTDTDRAEVQSKIWDAAATKRDAKINANAADIADTADFTGESETGSSSDTDSPAPRGAVQRTNEGKLHLQEGKDVIQNDDGSTTRVLKVGNPNEETSYNRYGYIKFREYDDKVVVDDFRMSPGRENIKREFFDEFSSRFAGKNVEWEPRGESAKAFAKEIIAGNPAGTSAGLQYYRDTDAGTVRGRVKLDNQIKQFLPRLDENERAAAVALLETRAAAKGQDLETYLGETFHPTVFSDSKTTIPEAAQSAGLDSRGVKGGVAFPKDDITGSAKALVYVTQKSDFSTYTHEIAHVFRRELAGADLTEAENAFGVKDGSWSRDAEERFAVGFEEYLREGKAPTSSLESLFRKMAEFLHRIYNALAARVEVSPDIRHVYDKLLAGSGPLAEIAKTGKTEEKAAPSAIDGEIAGQEKNEKGPQPNEAGRQEPAAREIKSEPHSLADSSKSILDAAGAIYSTIPDDLFFQAAAAKKLLEHMTREELIELLHTSDAGGGIPNFRAYRRDIETEGIWPVQVSLDADSLKWVNDNMGHSSGDDLLREIGHVMQRHAEEFGVRVYHKSGDEFLAQAKTADSFLKFQQAVDKDLKGVILKVEDPETGYIITKEGIYLSAGIDIKGDMDAADRSLEAEKHYRQDIGERAGRGEVPPGVRVQDNAGRDCDRDTAVGYFAERSEVVKARQKEQASQQNEFNPERVRELKKIIQAGGDLLFQTDEELIKDAATFDSWQDFMEYYEDSPFSPDDAAVPEHADAQWYQTVWEKAHGIIPEESLNAEEMAERAAADSVAPGSPDTKDALWLAEMQSKPEELNTFLRRINDILTTKNDFAPADVAEQQDMENTERLKRRITTEFRHGSWISNATRVGAGRQLTEKARRTLISLMRGAARDYRALYADLMEDPTWSVALADTDAGKLAAIADPKLEYSEMSPEQRRKIADRIENAEIARKLKSGELTFDEAQRHIAYLNKELKDSEARELEVKKQLADEKNETSEDYRRISDWETRQLLKANEEFLMAKARHESRSDKTARMIERGQAITKKYELESQQIKATYDTVFRKFSDLMKAKEISGAVETALARRESLFEARAESARLREQISTAREARKIRIGLAKRTMRRVSFDRVDYESARKIIAIQRAFFPAIQKGLNKWIGTEGPYLREVYSKWKTSDEYRIQLEKELSHRKGGRKLLALLDKDFDTWTRTEREDALKVLPKEDWVSDLNLEKLAEEREQSLQMDESSDEYKKLVAEALPSRIVTRIEKRPFAEWTIEEMEELAGVVDKLYSDGRRLLEAKKLARRDDAAEIRDRIKKAIKDAGINEDDSPEEKDRKRAAFEEELGMNRQVKGTHADSAQRQSFKNRVLRNGYADANVRRVARILDGGKDGINTDLLYNHEDSCYNEKHIRIRDRTRTINAAMSAAGVTLDELYQPVEIKDFYGPGQGRTFTIDELLFTLKADEDHQSRAAVKYGNMIDDSEKDSFRGEVTGGIIENLAAPRYNAVLTTARALDQKFLTFADAISADYANQYERLNAASIEEFNQPVWRVQKYVPLMRLESSGDTNENRVRDDLLNLSGGRNQSGADKGMTQKRIEIDPLYQRPVQMGLYSTWNDSVARTEHFVAYASYVRELNRVYKSVDASNMRGWIRARYGDKMVSYLDDYINECANPEAIGKQSQLDRIVRTLRGRTAPAYLAWKLSGVLKQFVTSPAPYLTFVSPAEYASAALDVARNYSTLSDTIREKSVYMDSRVMDPIIDLIKEQQAKASDPLSAGWLKISDVGMKGLEFADWSCVAPGWLAVYRKTLAQAQRENATIIQAETARLEKENEARPVETMRTAEEIKAIAEGKVKSLSDLESIAVKAADDATRMCQPSGRLTDLAPMFKAKGENTEALKIITQFQTSLNVIWQNIRYDLPNAVREKQYRQAVGIVGGYVAAGVAVNLMTQGLAHGGGDDDDSLSRARSLLYYSTTQFTDSVPLVGDMVTNLAQKAITGKSDQMFGDDMFPAASKVIQAGQAATSGDWDRTLQRFGEGIGYGIGAPVSGIKEVGRAIGFDGQDGNFDVNPEAFIGRRK